MNISNKHKNKWDLIQSCPYSIIKVHTNNTVTIRKKAYLSLYSVHTSPHDIPWSGRMNNNYSLCDSNPQP